MNLVHVALGWLVPVGFGVLTLWSAYCLVRNRPPAGAYWSLLAVLQVVVGLQLVAGLILFVLGGRPDWLHYAYGAFFPIALLVGAHRLGTRYTDIPWVVFGISSFLICGLTIRALLTGLETA